MNDSERRSKLYLDARIKNFVGFSLKYLSETIEDDVLEKVAKILGVTKEAIDNFSDEAVITYFNTFNDNSINQGQNYHCTFNPLDKLIELVEENKKLYERLLQAEKEKNELLKGK